MPFDYIVVAMLLVVGYAVVLQRKAMRTQSESAERQKLIVDRHQETIQDMKHSMEMQAESVKLAAETNALLRELIAKFPSR